MRTARRARLAFTTRGRAACAAAVGAALLSLPFVPQASGQQPWDALVSPAVKAFKAVPQAIPAAPPKVLPEPDNAPAATAPDDVVAPKAAVPAAPPKAASETKAAAKPVPRPRPQAAKPAAKSPPQPRTIAVPFPVEEKPPAPAASVMAPQTASKIETGAAEAKPARDYCANIADAAADARLAWQKKSLAEIEAEIEKRIGLLEAKTAELRQWVARRDEFSKKAHEGLIRIYARMKPDAAAVQLANLEEETAAALLTKLEPRNASAILAEMEPAKAAKLTATISGAAKVPPPAPPPPKAPEKPS